MKFNDAFQAAKPSIIGLIILSLVKLAVVNLMKGSVLTPFTGLPSDIVFFALILYAGYRATRVLGHDIKTAALAGALAALVQSVVWIVLVLFGMAFIYQTGQVPIPSELISTLGSGGTLAALLVMSVVLLAVISLVSVFVNAAVGAVGGFIGKRLK